MVPVKIPDEFYKFFEVFFLASIVKNWLNKQALWSVSKNTQHGLRYMFLIYLLSSSYLRSKQVQEGTKCIPAPSNFLQLTLGDPKVFPGSLTNEMYLEKSPEEGYQEVSCMMRRSNQLN